MEWKILISVFLFLSCGCFASLLINQARSNQVFEKTAEGVKRIADRAKENSERRRAEEERLQREFGNREKKNIFYRMDEALIRVGIRRKVPWLTVEYAIVIMAVFMSMIFYIIHMLSNSFIIGIGAVAVLVMAVLIAVRVIIAVKQKKVEDNILQFANLLGNYSRTSDDIVSIFGRIYVYLDEPLRTAVADCYSQTMMTGDFKEACARMDVTIGNRYFSDMLMNLEVCSRHEANYEEVIAGNKQLIRNYLSERDVRNEMGNQARGEIIILLLLGLLVFVMLNSMTKGILTESLLHTQTGNAILALLFLLVTYCMKKIFTIGGD